MNIRRIIKVSFLTALLPVLTLAIEPVDRPIAPITDFRIGNLWVLADRIINFILQAVSVVAVVMLIWAGYLFMTGNEENITKAKTILKYAIVGIIVVILSFSVIAFVQSVIGQG